MSQECACSNCTEAKAKLARARQMVDLMAVVITEYLHADESRRHDDGTPQFERRLDEAFRRARASAIKVLM